MLSRKQTAWKKSRKLGDVHGGRSAPKITDKIFSRAHSLQRPAPGQATPILIEDNPSRDYFFPLDGAECLQALAALPAADIHGLTHLWLRRPRRSESARSENLAEFICGSGVRLIVLYPWRRDLRLCVGRLRPAARTVRVYQGFQAELVERAGSWYFDFDRANLRRFYVEHLLYHEVGHHVSWYQRHWSKASGARLGEFADQYAIQCRPAATRVIRQLASPPAAADESPIPTHRRG
jgi:hypothetical protein